MSKHINLEGDKLVLTFPFDPAIVARVRQLDGRQFVAGRKRWEIPKENVNDVITKLAPLGFTPSLEVVRMKQQEDKLLAEIENIKLSDGEYTGSLPLYPFQKKGANFLKQMPHCLLADVPGLGKSIQTLAGTEDDPQVLIWCPASLKYSWKVEIEKWIPGADVVVVDGDKVDRMVAWGKGKKAKYIIANYELLLHDFDLIKDHEWHTIVCDEATRISNSRAKTVKALKALKSKKRIALTGTPISNSPEDIYSILDWFVPRYLGALSQFRDKYCIMDEFYYDRVVGHKNLDELAVKVDRFMLRRTKEEVFPDMPPKTTENIIFNLSSEEQELYDAIREQILDEVKHLSDLDTQTLSIVPVKMLRLKQCTGSPKLVEADIDSSKVAALKELLKPIIDSGDKAIIFTQFAEMLWLLQDALKEYNPLSVYGDVRPMDRMVAVDKFNKDPERKVILMTEAGAYGLNMQAASYVVHYDAPWSLAKLLQREDRAHRHGQKKPVTVYNLIAKGTIDEYVLKVLKKKGIVSDNILKDGDRSGLTKKDINEILES